MLTPLEIQKEFKKNSPKTLYSMSMNTTTEHKAMHTERDSSGRFAQTNACDCCGKPVGTVHATDDEVCGLTDGPGFYLCDRKRCEAKRAGLTVEERAALYVRR